MAEITKHKSDRLKLLVAENTVRKSSESQIDIAIADDHKIFRDGMKVGFKKHKTIHTMWEAQSLKDMLRNLQTQTPQILFVDIRLLHPDAVKTIKTLRKDYERLKIIVLSMHDDKEIINALMEHGANAFLKKTTDADEMYEAMVACCRDNFYFNDLVNSAVLMKLQQKKNVRKFYPQEVKFNERELSIFKLLSDDKTTEEIAAEIFSSTRTVEHIRQAMKSKVGVRTVAGLIMYAVRNKLVE